VVIGVCLNGEMSVGKDYPLAFTGVAAKRVPGERAPPIRGVLFVAVKLKLWGSCGGLFLSCSSGPSRS